MTADLRYAPYYCEENVYHLCAESSLSPAHGVVHRRVVIISNERRCCALWAQRAAASRHRPVLWDYHVIFSAQTAAESWLVWDLDTRLGFPVSLPVYLSGTFRPLDRAHRWLAPRFRIQTAEDYRAHFSSDRSHMRADNGEWLQPPPPWPPIHRADQPSFLHWTEMGDEDADPVTLSELPDSLEASVADR
jgi:hypothetical protein